MQGSVLGHPGVCRAWQYLISILAYPVMTYTSKPTGSALSQVDLQVQSHLVSYGCLKVIPFCYDGLDWGLQQETDLVSPCACEQQHAEARTAVPVFVITLRPHYMPQICGCIALPSNTAVIGSTFTYRARRKSYISEQTSRGFRIVKLSLCLLTTVVL